MSESRTEPMPVPEWTLGDRLRKSLDHADVTVEAMAEYLGYSTATMRNWTHDRVVPRPTVLRQWALRCGVPYEWLIDAGGDATTCGYLHLDTQEMPYFEPAVARFPQAA